MKILVPMLVILMAISLTSNSILAQAPQLINYQGKLINSDGESKNGPVNLRFRIYSSATTGPALWDETHPGVPVANGIFNVMLGSIKPFSQASEPLFTGNGERYLGISVDGGTELDRFMLTSVAYAIRATQADNADKATQADGVANNSINSAALANDAVTSAKIGAGEVQNSDLGANAVTSAKIGAGEVQNSDLGANSVTSAKIGAGEVQNSDLGANSVTSDKIANGQVVKSINNLEDNVTLKGGNNIEVKQSGNTITIDGQGGGSGGSAGVSRGAVVNDVIAIQGEDQMFKVVSTILTAPADGYVIVTATGQGRFVQSGGKNAMNYQIREKDEPRQGDQNPGFHSLGYENGQAPNAKVFLIASIQRVFDDIKKDKQYEFIFEARERVRDEAGAEQGFWNPQITALFVPQQYGDIVKPVGQNISSMSN